MSRHVGQSSTKVRLAVFWQDKYGILIGIKWPGVLKEDHFEIVRRSTFEQLPHWTTVITTSVRIKNQKLSVPDFLSLRSLANVFFYCPSLKGNALYLSDESQKVKYEVIVWRNLSRIFLLWLSFTLSEFTSVHFSSQKNQEIKILPFSKKNSKEIN